MCYGCMSYDEVRADVMDNELESAYEFIGPRTMPSGEEPERIARYVAGWHDALDYLAKKAGLIPGAE